MAINLSESIITRLKGCFSTNLGDSRIFDLFISPFAGNKYFTSHEHRVSLTEVLPENIRNNENRSYVILGDSGLGKTTLNLWLCAYFWDNLNTYNRLPIYIHLPQILKDRLLPQDILDVYLRNYFTEEERIQIKHQPLLLLLDGYDEIPDRKNIYSFNRWYSDRGFDVKVVTTCRPEVLNLEESISSLFEIDGKFELFYLQHFEVFQIKKYIQQFIENAPEEFREHYAQTSWVLNWENEYDRWLNLLPTLLELAKNPYLLSMITQSLPEIVEQYRDRDEIDRAKLTQTDVFEAFTKDWFLYQAKRLERNGNLIDLNREQKIGYLKAYAQNLASRLILMDGQLSQKLLTDEDTLIPHLVEPIYDKVLLSEYESGHRDSIFAKPENLIALRRGCLLKSERNRYKFLHKSLIEFLAARELFDGLRGEYDLYLHNAFNAKPKLGLNRQLIKDKGVISRLVERVNIDERFKDLLFKIIQSSKDTPGLSIMAANAVTVLNKAGVNFSGLDFRDIQIPGADLSYALCDHTDFRGANLDGVSFYKTWLKNSRLDGANCANIFFGEQAYLTHESPVNSIAFYKNEEVEYLLAGCSNGCVYQWNSYTHRQTRVYNHNGVFFWDTSFRVSHITVSNSQRILIAGLDGCNVQSSSSLNVNRIWLWSLETGSCIQKIATDYKIFFLQVSINKEWFVSQEGGDFIKLRDLTNGKELRCFRSRNWRHAMSVSDKWLAIYSSNIKLINVSAPHQARDLIVKLKLVYRQNRPWINYEPSVSFSLCGNWLVFGTSVGMQLWSLPDNSEIIKNDCCASAVTFSPRGDYLASGNNIENTVQLWFMPNLTLASEFHNYGNVSCLAFDTLGNWLVSTDDQLIRIWNVPNTNEVCHVLGKLNNITFPRPIKTTMFLCGTTNSVMISPIMFSPDGRWLALKSGELFSLPSMIQIFKYPREIFDISNNYLVTIGINSDKEAEIFSVPSGLRIRHLSMPEYSINRACFSSNGDWLALVVGNRLKLYRLQSEEIYELNNLRVDPDSSLPTYSFLTFDNFLILGNRSIKAWSVYETTFKEEEIKFGASREHLHIHTNRDNEYITWKIVGNNLEIANNSTNKTTLIQNVFEKYGHYSEIIFSCKDDFFVCAENIYTLKLYETSGKYVAQLTLWFKITGTKFSRSNFILVVSSDFGFVLIGFNSGDMRQWELLYSSIPRPLNINSLSITQVVGLSEQTGHLCRQRNTIGSPASAQQPYRAWCTLFRPIPGTAGNSSPFALLSRHGASHYSISSEEWVVGIIRKKKQSTDWSWKSVFGDNDSSYHTYLLIEGVKNYRRFIIRTELRVDDDNKVLISVDSQCDDEIPEHSIKNLKARLASSQIKAWSITKKQGMDLLTNARIDQQEVLTYSQMSAGGKMGQDYHNCVTWCKRQLSKIQIDLPDRWYDSVVVFPSDLFADIEVGSGFGCTSK